MTTAAAPQGVQTVLYSYDDEDRLVSEVRGDGSPLRAYIWADENLIGQAEYKVNATNTGYEVARVLYYELDHLGTPRQARLYSGEVQWRWESDGYGNTLPNEDPDGNGQPTTVNLRFPGQYYDAESGLHYNWHRYYVPRLGRYLSSDPIWIAGDINTYSSVVEGSPLNYTDPNGLFRVTENFGGIAYFGPWGTTLETGFGFDSRGNVCIVVNTCAPSNTGTIGAAVGLGGILIGEGGYFCPGNSTSYSEQITIDFGIGGVGEISRGRGEDGRPTGFGKGFGGVGVGAGTSFRRCETRTMDKNLSPF